ncbi:hypothetical protein [Dactylosporangium sp. NPDC048998]|uniref:hypothetical protein n=1 Tax=Dactylosporangium sp. NPDC048998 TaxID=3363976 RepID=UPI003713114D
MGITVDEAFLDNAAKINDTIAQDVVNSPKGDIKTIVLKPGHNNFTLGNNVNAAVAKTGADLDARLTEIRETASLRSTQLKMFIAVTNDTESLNDLTAQDFLTKTPSWNTGSK